MSDLQDRPGRAGRIHHCCWSTCSFLGGIIKCSDYVHLFFKIWYKLLFDHFFEIHTSHLRYVFNIVESKNKSCHVFLSCDFKLFVLNWVWEPGCTSHCCLFNSHSLVIQGWVSDNTYSAPCGHKPEGKVQVETCKWHNSWFVTNKPGRTGFCFTDKLIVVQSRFFSFIQWNLHDWMLSWQWNQFQAVSGESALWLICTQNSDGLNLFVSEILELWTKSTTKNKTNLVILVNQTSCLIWCPYFRIIQLEWSYASHWLRLLWMRCGQMSPAIWWRSETVPLWCPVDITACHWQPLFL